MAGEPDEVECRFTANAFLTGMVRRLVGALALVGEGRLTVADFQAILEARDKNHPGARGSGLWLVPEQCRISSWTHLVGDLTPRDVADPRAGAFGACQSGGASTRGANRARTEGVNVV